MADIFSKKTVSFLRALGRNNKREWFEAHRADYEEHLLQPCKAFLAAAVEPFRKTFPWVSVTPRSMTRIYRDTRFSADKSPYKNWMGFQLRDRSLPDEVAPGLWIGFDPTGIAYGAGVYHFDTPLRDRFRTDITEGERSKAFGAAIARARKAGFEPHGAELKRIPPGFDPKHRHAPFLLHNGLYMVKEIDFPAAFFTDRFAATAAAALAPCAPFFQWMRELGKRAPRSQRRFMELDSVERDAGDRQGLHGD